MSKKEPAKTLRERLGMPPLTREQEQANFDEAIEALERDWRPLGNDDANDP